ncbi:hypothetical protein [Variovorax sp. JS1663]|uniref:hypothetical protein n=1 Tax=Variovorax sp. JS1663 TaxID=1851577 RepID=UPI000B343E18|nr:hypothetical protein [Variovorax sp. JS1663]OUL99490.1 hypothetical protein A8M77_26275 [Variovorax sp. JS1663]
MTLDQHPHYPSSLSYVLKLHRDAAPGRGQLCGRLENIASGHSFRFASVEELLAGLARDAAGGGAAGSLREDN